MTIFGLEGAKAAAAWFGIGFGAGVTAGAVGDRMYLKYRGRLVDAPKDKVAKDGEAGQAA